MIDHHETQPVEPLDLAAPWRGLTTLPAKRAAYWLESPFRESLEDATEVLGPSLYPFFQSIATILFRPDAYAGRRLETAIGFLEHNGFRVIDNLPVTVCGLRARELYRYQWNIATLDRIAVFDLLTHQAPWWLLTLQDLIERPNVPASIRLRSLKGHVIPERRVAGTLRAVCAAPNRILTIAHSADEPADIIRELGLFLSRPERLDWLTRNRAIRDGHSPSRDSVGEAIPALYAQVPSHSLSVGPSVAAVTSALRAEGLTRQAVELTAASARPAGVHLPFRRWYHEIAGATPRLNPWDLIVAGSALIDHDTHGGTRTIAADGRRGWMHGHGRLEWKPLR